MSFARRSTLLRSWALVAVPLIVTAASQPARAGISMSIKDQAGEELGKINVDAASTGLGEGLSGGFDVTRTDGNGNTLTVQQLETLLHQDHLNWFQKVIADNNPPLDANGNPLTPPYVDPPSGGYVNQWADDRPWYWDEYTPAPDTPNFDPIYQLSNQYTNGNTSLHFEDFPGGVPGTVVSFATFLISDYGNKTYSVFGGFTWTVTVASDGTTSVTELTADASFTSEYATEIGAFGYSLAGTTVPEPASLLLAGTGFALAALFGRTIRYARAA